MDFRTVDPASITWASGWSRGNPLARTQGGARITVQSPACPCRVSPTGGGMYRIDMALVPGVKPHDAFAAWIADLEDAAKEASDLREWREGRSHSTCVFNNNFRLMAFSDTLTFDRDGKLSADLMDAASCACMLELQGCWRTDGRWGVRWKIGQVKFDLAPMTLPAEVAGDDLDAPPPEFAFTDDV